MYIFYTRIDSDFFAFSVLLFLFFFLYFFPPFCGVFSAITRLRLPTGGRVFELSFSTAWLLSQSPRCSLFGSMALLLVFSHRHGTAQQTHTQQTEHEPGSGVEIPPRSPPFAYEIQEPGTVNLMKSVVVLQVSQSALPVQAVPRWCLVHGPWSLVLGPSSSWAVAYLWL